MPVSVDQALGLFAKNSAVFPIRSIYRTTTVPVAANLDKQLFLRYPYQAFGRDRRGRILRTPPGPRGSSGKEVTLGAAGKPARRILIPR
jgi:hypothetical protein